MQNKKTLSEILIENECPVGFEVDCDLFNNHACLVGVTYDEIVIKSAAQELKDKEQTPIVLDNEGRLPGVLDGRCLISPVGKKTTWREFRHWKCDTIMVAVRSNSRYLITEKKEYRINDDEYRVVLLKDGYTYICEDPILRVNQKFYNNPEKHLYEIGDTIRTYHYDNKGDGSEPLRLRIVAIDDEKYYFDNQTSGKISSVDSWEHLYYFKGDYSDKGNIFAVNTPDGNEFLFVFGSRERIRHTLNWKDDEDIVSQFTINPDGTLADVHNFSQYSGFRLATADEQELMQATLKRENKKIGEDGIIVYTGQARLSSNTYGELSDVRIVGIENKKAEKIKKFIRELL